MRRIYPLVIVFQGGGDLETELPVKLYCLVVVDLNVQVHFDYVGIILAQIQCILKQL